MFSTRVLTFLAICLCTLQLSTCNVIKLSAKNGNKNINKIKVGWITLLPFFVLSFRDLFAIVLFFYLLADSCCSKGRNNYKYSTSPNPNHSSFHVEIQLLPGICKSTLLFQWCGFSLSNHTGRILGNKRLQLTITWLRFNRIAISSSKQCCQWKNMLRFTSAWPSVRSSFSTAQHFEYFLFFCQNI